jgi:hypothetical protein
LIKEGGLLAPWVTELRTACEKSRANLQNRELVIDLKNLTAISQEGENVLLTKGQIPLRPVYQTRLAATRPQKTRNRKDAEIEPPTSSSRASTLSENYPKKVFTEFWPF